jgi:Bacterial Ig domain/Right handed beta helix region
VNGFSNVVIRDVQIVHQGGHGIYCNRAPGLIIENVDIEHSGARTSSSSENNINCLFSDGLRVRNAHLRGGSTGVYVQQSSHTHLSYLEGHDFRGPFPRGQLVQFNNSSNCILEDFSAINDQEVAWTEDNVSVYFSDNCVVRRGHLNGNNSPSGVGVMFEGSRNGLVEDVDTVAQGNGSFSAYPGHDITFRRTRARDNICESQAGRGEPMSNALVWAGSPDSSGLRLEGSKYFNLCNPSNLVWDRSSFDVIQVTQENFSPRPAIQLSFAWEDGSAAPPEPEPAPDPEPVPEPDPDDPDPATDITPPSVHIMAPADGSVVRRRSYVQIEAAATDDSGIRSVTIRLDGAKVAMFLGEGPYHYTWRVPADPGRRVTISAQADDKVGNVNRTEISVKVRRWRSRR